MNAIETYELSRFAPGAGPAHVLREVTLTLPEGVCVGLMGGNGAGKSTLLKLLLGLAPIGHGKAFLFGEPVPTTASRQGVAYLPEHAAPFEFLTGREYLRFYVQLEGFREPEVRRFVEAALESAGLASSADVLTSRYSKGMMQRLELARTLMTTRRLLILDEPVTALDAASELKLANHLASLKKQGVTMVITSHSLGILERLCDCFVILQNGRLVRSGAREEILGVKGWCIGLEPGIPSPDPLPNGATWLVESHSLLFADRDAAERILAEYLGRRHVVSFGSVMRGIDDVMQEVMGIE